MEEVNAIKMKIDKSFKEIIQILEGKIKEWTALNDSEKSIYIKNNILFFAPNADLINLVSIENAFLSFPKIIENHSDFKKLNSNYYTILSNYRMDFNPWLEKKIGKLIDKIDKQLNLLYKIEDRFSNYKITNNKGLTFYCNDDIKYIVERVNKNNRIELYILTVMKIYLAVEERIIPTDVEFDEADEPIFLYDKKLIEDEFDEVLFFNGDEHISHIGVCKNLEWKLIECMNNRNLSHYSVSWNFVDLGEIESKEQLQESFTIGKSLIPEVWENR